MRGHLLQFSWPLATGEGMEKGTLWGMFLVENIQALEARYVFGGWKEESWATASVAPGRLAEGQVWVLREQRQE